MKNAESRIVWRNMREVFGIKCLCQERENMEEALKEQVA